MSGYNLGPGGCCCCNNLYKSGIEYFKVGKDSDPVLTAVASVSPGGYDFDPKNKQVLYRPTSTTIRIAPYELASNSLIHTVVGSFLISNRLACNADHEKLYYLELDAAGGNNRYIRRVDYTGANYTAIITKTTNGSLGDSFLSFSNVSQQVFYAMEPAGSWLIGRCEDDGTGDTTIYSLGTNLSIEDLEIDNRNEKVVFIEEDTLSPLQYFIKRCDFDGSNMETLRSGPFFSGAAGAGNWRFEGLQYSAKHDKIYWFEYDSTAAANGDTTGGFFQMDPDGTNVEMVFSRDDLNDDLGDGNTGFVRLGCGFETTGAGSLG